MTHPPSVLPRVNGESKLVTLEREQTWKERSEYRYKNKRGSLKYLRRWVSVVQSRLIYPSPNQILQNHLLSPKRAPRPSFAFVEPSALPPTTTRWLDLSRSAQSDIERAILFLSFSGKRHRANTFEVFDPLWFSHVRGPTITPENSEERGERSITNRKQQVGYRRICTTCRYVARV